MTLVQSHGKVLIHQAGRLPTHVGQKQTVGSQIQGSLRLPVCIRSLFFDSGMTMAMVMAILVIALTSWVTWVVILAVTSVVIWIILVSS